MLYTEFKGVLYSHLYSIRIFSRYEICGRRQTCPPTTDICKVSAAGGRRARGLGENPPDRGSSGAKARRKSPGPKARGRFSESRSARGSKRGKQSKYVAINWAKNPTQDDKFSSESKIYRKWQIVSYLHSIKKFNPEWQHLPKMTNRS